MYAKYKVSFSNIIQSLGAWHKFSITLNSIFLELVKVIISSNVAFNKYNIIYIMCPAPPNTRHTFVVQLSHIKDADGVGIRVTLRAPVLE